MCILNQLNKLCLFCCNLSVCLVCPVLPVAIYSVVPGRDSAQFVSKIGIWAHWPFDKYPYCSQNYGENGKGGVKSIEMMHPVMN